MSKTPGLPPGHLTLTGPTINSTARLTQIIYDAKGIDLVENVDPAMIHPIQGRNLWLHVNGIHDLELLASLGNTFGFHPLIQEDILNQGHRPKVDLNENNIFLVLKWPKLLKDHSLTMGHVAILFGPGWLISFQEAGVFLFSNLIQRLKGAHHRIRKRKPDYLAYALMDTIVDQYYPLLDQLDTQIEIIDERLEEHTLHDDLLWQINHLKKNVLYLWKTLWSLKDLGNKFQKMESGLVEKKNYVFLRDVQDHLAHQVELSEMLRIRLDDLSNMYLNIINVRMNQIMKTLTIVGAIFIPLTFLVGVYGMNFQNMPELQYRYGYLGVWSLMIFIVICLLLFFKHRKWF